jgi:hypothetical protein
MNRLSSTTLAIVLVFSFVCALTASGSSSKSPAVQTIGPNLIYNGDFDNGIWYERFRGWSPAGWYQWFTCGDDAPEHAVGKDKPHSGKEYVRIHMWAYAWRGGILQNVKVDPCHWYKLTAWGWFAKTAKDPQADLRVGIDPYGKLASQFSVDVTKHPAPPYNECVGDDPKTPEKDWPDIPETTVWDGPHAYYDDWGKFEVMAEAKSDTITVILYSNSPQRGPEEPIYEMNWDTVSLYEVPWPTKRLADENAVLPVDERLEYLVVNFQPKHRTAQVTWLTKTIPTGASQVLYRFVDAKAAEKEKTDKPVTSVRLKDFPYESPVVYERSATWHRVELTDFKIPKSAVELQVVALSRALINGECRTLCSPVAKIPLVKPKDTK